jgi:hypothetical protein
LKEYDLLTEMRPWLPEGAPILFVWLKYCGVFIDHYKDNRYGTQRRP